MGSSAERLRWEQILTYAPDVLIVAPCNPSLERTLMELHLLAAQPGFWALPAVRANELYIVAHQYLSRPGPRLVDGVQILARILHPSLVDAEAPDGSCMKLNIPQGQRCRPHQLRTHFVPFK